MATGDGVEPSQGISFAERLDHLFRTVHPQGRGEYSYREVARGIEDHGGPRISASYIHALRSGAKDNPTMRAVEGLATFFGVPIAYFFDDSQAQRINDELELLTALRDAGVRQIALRAVGLPPEGLESIRQMVELARNVSGLRNGGSTLADAAEDSPQTHTGPGTHPDDTDHESGSRS